MAFKLNGAKEQIVLKCGGVLAVLLLAGYWIHSDQKKRTESGFHGVVVEKYWRRSTSFGQDSQHRILTEDGTSGTFSRRRPHYYVDVKTAAGVVDHELDASDLRRVELGDYVLKFAGQEQLALFREGIQLTPGGNFRSDAIRLPDSIGRAMAGNRPPDPEVIPTPAPPKPTQDANIRAMLDQASQLWRAGEKDSSIVASEKALTLTDMAYGRASAQFRELEAKIAAAKRAMK